VTLASAVRYSLKKIFKLHFSLRSSEQKSIIEVQLLLTLR